MIQINPKKNLAAVTPSTRDLMQFISPNPKSVSPIFFFVEESGEDLLAQDEKLKALEDKNPAALIIDTRQAQSIVRDDYLTRVREILDCPILRFDNVAEEDALFDSRVLQFDGQVMPVTGHDASSYFKLAKRAESIHFRLIPCVSGIEDFDVVATTTPHFVWLADDFDGEIPPIVKSARVWFMGSDKLLNKYPLKCVATKI